MADLSDNKTNETVETSGNIRISDEVIGTIAAIATRDVKGIAGLGTSLTSEIAQKFVKKSSSSKGIKISSENDFVTIDISIQVKYGVDIPSTAWEVQDSVKKSVEAMTGLTVEKVNVHIVGIQMQDGDNLKTSETKTEEEN